MNNNCNQISSQGIPMNPKVQVGEWEQVTDKHQSYVSLVSVQKDQKQPTVAASPRVDTKQPTDTNRERAAHQSENSS